MTTDTTTVTPSEFRTEVRAVVSKMELAERLAFLQAFPELADQAQLQDGRWFLPLDLVTQLGQTWATVAHARNGLGGVYHLLPYWEGTDQSRARDVLEVLAEMTAERIG